MEQSEKRLNISITKLEQINEVKFLQSTLNYYHFIIFIIIIINDNMYHCYSALSLLLMLCYIITIENEADVV